MYKYGLHEEQIKEMSVISNEHASSSFPLPMKVKRIAFAGCLCSGKTFSAKKVKSAISGPTRMMSLTDSIRELVFENKSFDNVEGYQTIGALGRTIDPEAWIKILTKQITQLHDQTNIIVDDVRYENEIVALRNMGFTILYMDTMWDIRLQRIGRVYQGDPPDFTKFISWFTHESETQLIRLPVDIFDHVIKDDDDLEAFIKTIDE